MQWESDRRLQFRMLVVLGLLVVLPLAYVWVLEQAVNWVLGKFGYEFLSVPYRYVLMVVLLGLVAEYLVGERLALRTVDATRVDGSEYPDLSARLARLSSQVDLPTPRLAVSSSPVPNAFAMGRSQSSATVVVTEGLLETLDDGDQLDAVLAHELAHVKNRDVMVMTVAYLLPSLTLGVVFWVGSALVFAFAGATREFAADRGAAKITGDPLALASALETLDEGMNDVPEEDLREVSGGVQALFVSMPKSSLGR